MSDDLQEGQQVSQCISLTPAVEEGASESA